jgi:phage terminase large subunit-like protein
MTATAATVAPPRLRPTDYSPLKRLAMLPVAEREAMLERYARDADLSLEQLILRISHDWQWLGRPKQQPPPGLWTYWLVKAGRGFGKTITGAQWSKGKALRRVCRFALIAPTLQDVRTTMVEGETGLLSILPDAVLRGGTRASAWNRTTCELYLDNGTKFQGFSSEVPDRLRGPQHHYAWGEEVSSWLDAKQGDVLDSTFSNMKLGLRLGENPQACLTSTPKTNKLTKDLLALQEVGALALTEGSSFENRDNLAEAWWKTVVAPLVGTRTGRQEVFAEMLEDVEGALWRLTQIEELRRPAAPPLARIVVGVDPNASSDEAANSAGIVVAGHDGRPGNARSGYVLADRTIVRGGPRAWAAAAVKAYYDFQADRIVAEKNQGGEMVELTIHTVDPNVPVKLVSASRAKRTRAEPVSALYEGSETVPPRVFHVGVFPELEEEMTTWTPESESPDRMDALVWALTELMLGQSGAMKSTVPHGRIDRPTRVR